MKLWLIGGSFSGLGKTRLANELAQLLSNSVRFKVGHGRRKKGGPENYFTESSDAVNFIESCRAGKNHCIAEATRFVGKIDADVVIFLNRVDDNRKPESDDQFMHADIILGDDSNPDEWMAKLDPLDIPVGLRRKILRILHSQNDFLNDNRLCLKTKIWFSRDGRVVFGEGLARLIEAVDKLGSLSRAAKNDGISYRHAWGIIRKAEERLGFDFLERQTGGSKGGGSKITPKASKLVDGYWQIKRDTVRKSDKLFEKLLFDLESEK
ncbi:MAG: LysR family transcriptional regulator [bacterium]